MKSFRQGQTVEFRLRKGWPWIRAQYRYRSDRRRLHEVMAGPGPVRCGMWASDSNIRNPRITVEEQAQWVLALYRACLMVDGMGNLLVFSYPRNRAQELADKMFARATGEVPVGADSRGWIFRCIRRAIRLLDEAQP